MSGWFERDLERMHGNRALEACAEFQVQEWERTLSPHNAAAARLLCKVALIPQAERMLAALRSLPEGDRKALAAALRT